MDMKGQVKNVNNTVLCVSAPEHATSVHFMTGVKTILFGIMTVQGPAVFSCRVSATAGLIEWASNSETAVLFLLSCSVLTTSRVIEVMSESKRAAKSNCVWQNHTQEFSKKTENLFFLFCQLSYIQHSYEIIISFTSHSFCVYKV